MWDTIKSGLYFFIYNPVQSLSSLIIIVMLTILLTKTGILRIKTAHVRIGNKEEDERTILRQQSSYAHSYCMSLEYLVPRNPEFNGYLTRYILERMYDEVMEWILFNHLTTQGAYIETKQARLRMLCDTLATREEYRSEDFHEFINSHCRKLIEELIHIREVYK